MGALPMHRNKLWELLSERLTLASWLPTPKAMHVQD
jgi:hypothetical protein